RRAIEKAIPLLESGSSGSANQRQCFTCHSQAIPVFALKAAQDQGFRIDGKNLNRQLKHTHEHLRRGLDGYREAKGQGGGPLTAGYALWTLEDGGWKSDEVTDAVCHYLLNFQKDRPCWQHPGNRPPSSGSDLTTTYVALRAIDRFSTTDQKDEFLERRKIVIQWIHDLQPDETEDLTFLLKLLHLVHADSETIARTVKLLNNRQRDDGGWSQKDDMLSDAYATSTVLVALHREGDVPLNDPSIVRGVNYLIGTQRDDGSWHVTTRAKPFQEYFESGFPHQKDQFISITATAWATLALVDSFSSSQGQIKR
ncbi:MAG: terpene cyclase/mutase family protein, partial [Planctomycetes bacterium]|nr:terpene cyclase/mutase family protein [Planctomycetota bacterium]